MNSESSCTSRTYTGFVTALPGCAADVPRVASEGAVTCPAALIQGTGGFPARRRCPDQPLQSPA
jgi:hypothetical protein